MSKGTNRITVRLGPVPAAEMTEAIAIFNESQKCREPMDVTEFVRIAIKERVAKLRRGRSKDRVTCPRCRKEGWRGFLCKTPGCVVGIRPQLPVSKEVVP